MQPRTQTPGWRPGFWSRAGGVRGNGAILLAVAVMASQACQPKSKPSDEPAPTSQPRNVDLSGVDTSKLTAREKEQWSAYVGDLLAPCSDQPVSLQQCVTEKRPCEACLPAARFLVGQVTAGKTGGQVEAAYRARFSDDAAKNIEVADSPSKGPDNAPVTIVEYADFQCPACAATSPILDQAVKRYPQSVRLVYKHFPLSIHEHAEAAARAAVAAHKQGKFWQMHDALFTNQNALDEAGIKRLAQGIGLDMKQFDEDRRSEVVVDQVTRDRKQAEALGLKGTPTVFINGRLFDSDHFSVLDDLHPWIELEVELKTGKEPPAAASGQTGTPPTVTGGSNAPTGAAPTAPATGQSSAATATGE